MGLDVINFNMLGLGMTLSLTSYLVIYFVFNGVRNLLDRL